jgi:hypothetical protein
VTSAGRGRLALTAALVAAGALVLHQLRYVLVYGGHAEEVLALHGHGYLVLLTPVVAAALVLSLRPLLGLTPATPPERVPRLAHLWALASCTLLATYVAQEWLEGALTHGHPEGLAGIVGNGGWTAALLAVAVGGIVAVALRAVELARPAARVATTPRPAAGAAPCAVVAMPAAPGRPRPDVMAYCLAGRAPPAAV